MENKNTQRQQLPDLSLVMPCYNEQANVRYAVVRLLKAFEDSNYRVQIVAVDNGSMDDTGKIISTLAEDHPEVTPARVATNVGFGRGILQGIPCCTAPWIGFVAADSQVDAEDVVRLFDAAQFSGGNVLAKVRRRFRMDGMIRKVISVTYNSLVWALWPRLGSLDVNGQPRIMRRESLDRMDLKSTDWLIDPEVIIKAHYLGLRVIEFNVLSRARGSGESHVRWMTLWEFFRGLMAMRFGGALNDWKRANHGPPRSRATTTTTHAGSKK